MTWTRIWMSPGPWCSITGSESGRCFSKSWGPVTGTKAPLQIQKALSNVKVNPVHFPRKQICQNCFFKILLKVFLRYLTWDWDSSGGFILPTWNDFIRVLVVSIVVGLGNNFGGLEWLWFQLRKRRKWQKWQKLGIKVWPLLCIRLWKNRGLGQK